MDKNTTFSRPAPCGVNVHKLAASERPNVLYRYHVMGPGDFPLDMLRYDAAWPGDSGATFAVGECMVPGRRTQRAIALHSYRAPTIARWESFLWGVGSHGPGAAERPAWAGFDQLALQRLVKAYGKAGVMAELANSPE